MDPINKRYWPWLQYDFQKNHTGIKYWVEPGTGTDFPQQGITALMFKLVKEKLLGVGSFVCPSTDDFEQIHVDLNEDHDFRDAQHVSYSYVTPTWMYPTAVPVFQQPGIGCNPENPYSIAVVSDKGPVVVGMTITPWLYFLDP